MYKQLSEIRCKVNTAVSPVHHISAHEEVRCYHLPLLSPFSTSFILRKQNYDFQFTEPEQFEMEQPNSILVFIYLSQKIYYSLFTISSKPSSLLLSKKIFKFRWYNLLLQTDYKQKTGI